MTFSDWLLFFHVASAFALVAALVVYWTIAIAARNVERPVDSMRYFRVAKPANVLIIVGTLGTLIFGIWLAIDFDAYQVWDGWILAAIVLWAISSSISSRSSEELTAAIVSVRRRRCLALSSTSRLCPSAGCHRFGR